MAGSKGDAFRSFCQQGGQWRTQEGLGEGAKNSKKGMTCMQRAESHDIFVVKRGHVTLEDKLSCVLYIKIYTEVLSTLTFQYFGSCVSLHKYACGPSHIRPSLHRHKSSPRCVEM